MKTLSSARPKLHQVFAGSLAIFFAAVLSAHAAGGVGGTSPGGSTGGPTSGGGSHGGGSVGSGGGGISSGTHVGSLGVSSGFHSGGPSASGVHSFGTSPVGFSHLTSGSLGNSSRFNGSTASTLHSPYNNAAIAAHNAYAYGGNNATVGATNGVPTVSRRFDGSPQNPARPTAPANNAWTDPRPAAPAARASRYGYSDAYDGTQSYNRGTTATGQHLYPVASGYTPRTSGNLSAGRGSYNRRGDGSFGRNRFRPYYNTGLYNPYLYGAFFPGYYGFFGDGYGSSAGIDGGYVDNSSNAADPAGAAYANSGSYYDQNGNAPRDPDTPAQSPDFSLPTQPANVGPQNPTADTTSHPIKPSGPDSLVEAVQDELSKRGYYDGKSTAVYDDSTRDSLRRFQTDHKLNVTGRINEATLHALQLD